MLGEGCLGDGEDETDLALRPTDGSLTGGDKDELLSPLFDCTVVESTMYFSILDCLLAKSSAPFPFNAGISKAEPKPWDATVLLAGTGDGTFVPVVYELIRRGGVG